MTPSRPRCGARWSLASGRTRAARRRLVRLARGPGKRPMSGCTAGASDGRQDPPKGSRAPARSGASWGGRAMAKGAQAEEARMARSVRRGPSGLPIDRHPVHVQAHAVDAREHRLPRLTPRNVESAKHGGLISRANIVPIRRGLTLRLLSRGTNLSTTTSGGDSKPFHLGNDARVVEVWLEHL